MTTRRQIVDAIIAELKSISTLNGYSYDQNAKDVYDWLTVRLDTDISSVAIELRDISDSVDSSEGYAEHDLEIEIALYVETGGATQDDTRDKMQDIATALKNVRDAQNAIIDIDFTGSEIEFDRERKLIGAALLRFVVRYNTDEFVV